MGFWRCALYLAAIGLLSAVAGLLPRRWFHADRFPYRMYRWEKNGEIYEKLGVHRWKDKLPDISRFLPWMTKKQLSSAPSAAQAERLLQETCVAELVHYILSLLTFACAAIWPRWGLLLAVVYILVGHLPYIVIQRYNRPRFARMHALLQMREARNAARKNKSSLA